MKKIVQWMSCLLLFSQEAWATCYTVDYPASTLSFSGEHAGNRFIGTFKTWSAEIEFDPVHIEKSHIKVKVDLESAHTGNAMYDGTLPQADWFDTSNHKEGVFTSSAIKATGDQAYIATGTLTLRGVTQTVALPFTLSDVAKPPVKAEGTLSIDRLAFGIGGKSDAKAEWVSKEIGLGFTLIASTCSP